MVVDTRPVAEKRAESDLIQLPRQNTRKLNSGDIKGNRQAMRVLLVYPEFPVTYWGFNLSVAFEGKRSACPPLGLLTIAAMLPSSWERRLLDMNISPLRRADLEWADLVLISAMIVQQESLRRVVDLCKRHGKRVIVGGPYITTSVESLPQADHIFLGEAETTFPEFLRDLMHGEPKRIYQASERPSLSLIPLPDLSLLDLKQYSFMSLQYSRGCPFNCEFCDIIEIYGRVPRTKSNEQVLAELDALLRAGWYGIVFIVDDNFIGNKRNVKLLLPELIEWSKRHHYPFSFATEASVNLADDNHLLAMMRAAGFRHVFVGIETPVEASLKETQKGQNMHRNLLESVEKIQSYGIEVMAGFIVGFDNDPDDIFERQINFIRDSAIPLATVSILEALPGTQLWRRLASEGRILAEATGNNTDSSLNFVPKMDAARLVNGYKMIMRTIYSPGEYYERVLNCLARVRRDSPAPRRLSFGGEIATLIRVVVRLGMRDHARREFWRYMMRVLVSHRQELPNALMLAAMGYHFRKLTEIYCQ